MSEEVRVRRAKRDDIPTIAALVRKATRSKVRVSESEVMDWLFSKGLWVGTLGEDPAGAPLVGVAAWQAENLLSVTDLFHVSPARLRATAGSQLLETIEAEASVLMCEANVLLLPVGASKAIRTFLQRQGYEPRKLDTLHRIWQEVLSDFATDETELMVKQLRERMIMVPI
jgi:N-acetylglutamate synthase-like GNAT family acetyltransferase